MCSENPNGTGACMVARSARGSDDRGISDSSRGIAEGGNLRKKAKSEAEEARRNGVYETESVCERSEREKVYSEDSEAARRCETSSSVCVGVAYKQDEGGKEREQ